MAIAADRDELLIAQVYLAGCAEPIEGKRVAGTAVLGIVHNVRILERLGSREVDVARFAAAA